MSELRKILASECLCGDRVVRYDGGRVPLAHPVFIQWKEEGRIVPICPEVFGGLPTPRPDSQRRGGGVFTGAGDDVTSWYAKGAEEALRLAREHDVAFAVLKEGSPSCGSKQIYDGSFSGKKIPGNGLAAEYLKNAGFTVFDEDEIAEAAALLAKLEAG
ncbi:MAG: DUF523 domain-containing protein [Clostridiales Family XIII bacterium]|jgi:uncharacterized protein YbbK (DUF523 family)|nr:DUF523 domain-containing protein [Clostridiales Family XIII bacterium]